MGVNAPESEADGAWKTAHGGQLSFHGGIDMQHLVTCGTPDEITAEARRYCEFLGAGGGYILDLARLTNVAEQE